MSADGGSDKSDDIARVAAMWKAYHAGERICENGSYFCKRDRNKAGTISIYTCQGRQTVRIPDTESRNPEEAELTLAQFVLSNAEAAARERDGIRKTDLTIREVLNIYALGREGFHNEVIRKLRERYATALAEDDAALVAVLPFQLKCALSAKAHEKSATDLVIRATDNAWKKKSPKVSQLEHDNQLVFVKSCRETGYADGTIRSFLMRLFSALNVSHRGGRLLYPPPRCLRYDTWGITTDEDEEVVVYELEELAALFNAAATRESWWRYMNLATSGARPMTLMEATWLQVTLNPARLNLNPVGKRRTKKRRPTIPLCHTLAAEVSSWKQDAARLITNGRGKQMGHAAMFSRIQRTAGITRGSGMSMRKTIRSWLMLNGVPEAIGDLFVGHADEGSATGRKFYKAKQPQYMAQAAAAIEKLYDALRPLVKRPFAGGAMMLTEDQPLPDTVTVGRLRGGCVAERRASL
jgi:hypothetical protein